PDALAVGRGRLRRAGKLSLEVQRLRKSGRAGEREKRREDENASHWESPLLWRHGRLFYAKRIRHSAPSWITRQSTPPRGALARRAGSEVRRRSREPPPAPLTRLQGLRLAIP